MQATQALQKVRVYAQNQLVSVNQPAPSASSTMAHGALQPQPACSFQARPRRASQPSRVRGAPRSPRWTTANLCIASPSLESWSHLLPFTVSCLCSTCARSGSKTMAYTRQLRANGSVGMCSDTWMRSVSTGSSWLHGQKDSLRSQQRALGSSSWGLARTDWASITQVREADTHTVPRTAHTQTQHHDTAPHTPRRKSTQAQCLCKTTACLALLGFALCSDMCVPGLL